MLNSSQSHHTGIETIKIYDFSIPEESPNRTILELKLLNGNGIPDFASSQSHHTGIEVLQGPLLLEVCTLVANSLTASVCKALKGL